MHPKNEYLCSSGRTGHGDHRPTIVCLAHHMNSSFFTRHLTTPLPTLRVHLFNVVFFHKIHKPRNLNPQTTEFKSTFYGFGCWRTGHGGHRPTLICLAHHMNSSFFTRHLTTPHPTLRVHLLNIVFFHKIHKLRNLNPQTTEFKSINHGI